MIDLSSQIDNFNLSKSLLRRIKLNQSSFEG